MTRSWALAMVLSGAAWFAGCGGDKDDSGPGPVDTDVAVECPLRWDCADGAVFTFFEVYCSECHDTAPMDFTNYEDVYENREVIRCGVAPGVESLPRCGSDPKPGDFPVGEGPMPENEERRLIIDWIDAGALE